MTDGSRPIAGVDFLNALADAGVVDRDGHLTRVVVVAAVDDALRLYVERIGDERLVAVTPTLRGVQVEPPPAPARRRLFRRRRARP